MLAQHTIVVKNCREWVRGSRVLVKQSGDIIEIAAAQVGLEDRAAIAYILIDLLQEDIKRSPLAVSDHQIQYMLDSLSAIAEFPNVNQQ